MLSFLRAAFPHSRIVNSYGITETGGVAYDGQIPADVSVKLVDREDLGYLATDLPHPRGEIVVQHQKLALGYWNDPEKTNLAFKVIHFISFFFFFLYHFFFLNSISSKYFLYV